MAETSLIIKVLAEYNAGQLKDADKDLDKLGKSASKLGLVAKGALVGAGVAAVKFGADSIKSFTSFDKGMREVFTLLPGISNDAMEQMKSGVLDFSKEAGRLPEEVIPAVYQAISAGVPQENVFDFMKVASQAAEGGVTDLETAVDGITSSMNAYGSETLSAAMASDLMFTAVKGGKTDFTQLSNSLFNVVPIASSLGVEFGNVTAALAAMTAQGVPTSVATTQLRQLFVELSKEGSETAALFESLAGKSFKQFVAEGGNVQQALQLLEQHAASTGVGVNDLFGSVEAGSAALTLTGKGTAKFASELEAAESAMGATAEASDTMGASTDKSVRQMQASFEALKVQVGERLAPAAVTAMGEISEAIDTVGKKIDSIAEDAGPAVDAMSGKLAEATAQLIQGNIENAQSTEDLVASGQRLVETYDDIGATGRLLTRSNEEFEQGFKDTLIAIAKNSDSLEDYEKAVKAVIGESDRLVGSYGVLEGEVTSYTKDLYAQTKATELARKEGALWTAQLRLKLAKLSPSAT